MPGKLARVTFNVLAALLLLALSILWVRSRYSSDEFTYAPPPASPSAHPDVYGAYSCNGRIYLGRFRRSPRLGVWPRPARAFRSDRRWEDALLYDYAMQTSGRCRGGFGVVHQPSMPPGDPSLMARVTGARVPHWALFLAVCVAAVLPGLVRAARRRSRRRVGLCPTCGYDLRASHDRCPECGTPIPKGTVS